MADDVVYVLYCFLLVSFIKPKRLIKTIKKFLCGSIPNVQPGILNILAKSQNLQPKYEFYNFKKINKHVEVNISIKKEL